MATLTLKYLKCIRKNDLTRALLTSCASKFMARGGLERCRCKGREGQYQLGRRVR